MKRGVLFAGIISLVASMGFVSAYSGGYNSLSFTGLFSQMNIHTYLLALFFILVFWAANYGFQKTPMGGTKASWIPPMIIAIFSVWGVSQLNLTIPGITGYLGIPVGLLTNLLFILGALAILIAVIKLGLRKFFSITLMLLGALLFILSVIGYVYEESAGIMLGIAMAVIGLILRKSGPGKIYRTGLGIGRGIGHAGSWAYGKVPKNIFKKEKRLSKRIKKIQERISRTSDAKEAKDLQDQLQFLEGRLTKIQKKAQKAQKKAQKEAIREAKKEQEGGKIQEQASRRLATRINPVKNRKFMREERKIELNKEQKQRNLEEGQRKMVEAQEYRRKIAEEEAKKEERWFRIGKKIGYNTAENMNHIRELVNETGKVLDKKTQRLIEKSRLYSEKARQATGKASIRFLEEARKLSKKALHRTERLDKEENKEEENNEKIGGEYEEAQRRYEKAEKNAGGYLKKLNESGRALENARARAEEARRKNQSVSKYERSYKRLLERTNDLNAKYQRAQLKLVESKRELERIPRE